MLLLKCVCSSSSYVVGEEHGISILRCTHCGIVRQWVHMTAEELAEWYRTTYKVNEMHTLRHDTKVAKLRLNKYRFSPGTRILDVGCGNGAFVAAARSRNFDAWGQDLASTSESEFVYVGALEDIAFPTESFDVITLHDVLEHSPDPLALLREIRRILRRPGKLIIDFPHFHVPAGLHHWKAIEHLWMFTIPQLIDVLKQAGFRPYLVDEPIPSKFVIESEKTPDNRPQILVPAGIGDAYWVLTKLPGFLKEKGLGMPDVWVQDSGGPKRTVPYLQTIPFIHAAGYKHLSDKDPIFNEAYKRDARTVFPDVLDVDYFIAYNGVMRFGRSLEEVDPTFGCDWRPKMHVSKVAAKMRERLTGPGAYALVYFADAGMYRNWLTDFSAEQLAQALRLIQKELGLRIIFMGAPWDQGQVGRRIAQMDDSFEDLIGATNFDQMLGAIQGATVVFGYPAGNTILATALNVPTVLLWNRYFNPKFWSYSCPPDSPYAALNTEGLSPGDILRAVKSLVEATRADDQRAAALTH